MKKETQTIEEVLTQALTMKEAGFSHDQIFAKFPDETKDLKSFFDTIEILKKQTNQIQGSEENLRKILAELDGPSPFLIRSPLQLSSFFKKYALVLSAGATLALVFILNGRIPKTPEVAVQTDTAPTVNSEIAGNTVATLSTPSETGNATPMMMKMAAAPTPSGSVDDAVSEINQSSSREGTYGNTTRDKELAAYDKKDVNNFTTTSYENIY